MNEGLQVPGRGGKLETLPQTNFFIGCAVSPFKRHERELDAAVFQAVAQARAGAQWVIPQLGYDMRKFHEVKLFLGRGASACRSSATSTGSPGRGEAVLQRQVGRLRRERRAAASGRKICGRAGQGPEFLNELAAKQLAVFKGLGFAAGYLGGIAKAETFGEIIDMAESYGENDWRDFSGKSSSRSPTNFSSSSTIRRRAGRRGADQPRVSRLAASTAQDQTGDARLPHSRLVHEWPSPGARGFTGCCGIFGPLGQKPGLMSRLAYWLERQSKRLVLRLPGLRRLQPARLRLSLPLAAAPRAPATAPAAARPRPLRTGRQGLLLGPGLRAAEVLRRVGDRCPMAPVVIYNAR